MRMRRKKHGAERIAACSEILIADPQIPAVDPNVYCSHERPIHLEIGCGKGDFAVGMASKYPEYNFAKHKGYGTKEHVEAILRYGPCEIHRMSFLKKITGGEAK